MTQKRKLAALILYLGIVVLLLCGCAKSSEKEIYASVEDLEGKRVGVLTGTTFDDMAEATWDNCELVYMNSFLDMIPALTSDKFDCFIADEPWLIYSIAQNSEVTYIPEMLAREDYGLVFAKNDYGKALRDEFNAFMAELPDMEQTCAELKEKWFNSSPDEPRCLNYDELEPINGTLHICTDATNPPFEFYEDGEIVGYNLELLFMFCESRGYGMQVEDMKFEALILAVNSGKSDIASSSFTITEERAESVYFSDPVYQSGPVVAIRTENATVVQQLEKKDSFFNRIALSFEKTFLRENRWTLFVSGIGITLLITVCSLVLGTALGFGCYLWYRRGGRVSHLFCRFVTWFITGMPEVLLLLILFYVVFGSTAIAGTWISVIAFSLIVSVNVFSMTEGGVSAIDRGQMEAALAVGYSDRQSFFKIIMPQALQYIMPNYRAGIVSLIKSTAIVGYLAVQDLTKVSDIVRSRTYEAFFPLLATAAIYFVLAWLLVQLVDKLQKKLLPFRSNPKTVLRDIRREEEAAK